MKYNVLCCRKFCENIFLFLEILILIRNFLWHTISAKSRDFILWAVEICYERSGFYYKQLKFLRWLVKIFLLNGRYFHDDRLHFWWWQVEIFMMTGWNFRDDSLRFYIMTGQGFHDDSSIFSWWEVQTLAFQFCFQSSRFHYRKIKTQLPQFLMKLLFQCQVIKSFQNFWRR